MIKFRFAVGMFLAFRALGTFTSAKIQRTAVIRLSNSEGELQAYYDDALPSSSSCQAVVMLNVGTAMTVGAYKALAESIVQQSTGVVAIIMDTQPCSVQKQSGSRYVNVANAIANNLTKLVPNSCCHQQPPQGYFIGGHSAGGVGAVRAMASQQLSFAVAGYIGLAPYKINVKTMSISVPSLLWGFSRTSCLVNRKQAALAAYDVSLSSSRVFYDVQTENRNSLMGGPHCSFADFGCLRMCSGGPEYSWIRQEAVGESVQRFISAVASQVPFETELFDIGRHDVKLYVNSDIVRSNPARPSNQDVLLYIKTDNTSLEAPIWPKQWSANFSIEWWGSFPWQNSTNMGSYHYDWTNGQSLEYHGKGQQDNWCGCASQTNHRCKILSYAANNSHSHLSEAAQFAVLPDENICCLLFRGSGGGPLKPDWMTSGSTIYNGISKDGSPKRVCQGWENTKPGNKLPMKGDLWLMDDNGVPCGYRDVFKWWFKLLGFGHYFTFDATTYSHDVDASIFDLPPSSNCHQPCPNRDDKKKRWCNITWAG